MKLAAGITKVSSVQRSELTRAIDCLDSHSQTASQVAICAQPHFCTTYDDMLRPCMNSLALWAYRRVFYLVGVARLTSTTVSVFFCFV